MAKRKAKTKKAKAKKAAKPKSKKKKQKAKPPAKEKATRPSTLTPQVAMQCAQMWRLKISDIEICDIIGTITKPQLEGWLKRNTKVKITLLVGEKKTPVTEEIGLRLLRTRERARLNRDYLQKLDDIIDAARKAGRFKAAITAIAFILERRFPKEFGSRQALDIILAETAMTDDEAEAIRKELKSRFSG